VSFQPTLTRTGLAAYSAALLACLVVSGWQPFDRTTWWLEVLPVLIVLPVLWATHARFPLSRLLYAAIFVHALILMLGGAYTYARVPLGDWVQSALALSRNPYDKLGHLAQGFVPALAVYEVLERGGHVAGVRMRVFLTVCVALAVSAVYELLEWAAAVALGQGADEFLGTQGDAWDTQSDMLCALIGASLAMLLVRALARPRT
jgi:putative membrane protein